MLRRLFPFYPDINKLLNSQERMSEIMQFFELNPSLEGRYFYRGLFEEYSKKSLEAEILETINIYKEGLKVEKCPACAAKLLLLHIEPCKLNNGIPDNNCEEALKQIVAVVIERGIIDYLDHQVGSSQVDQIHASAAISMSLPGHELNAQSTHHQEVHSAQPGSLFSRSTCSLCCMT